MDSGISARSVYIAKKLDCRVDGVDLSEKMAAWARERARAKRVADRVESWVGDVLDLPFEADRFDLVMVESVLISYKISAGRFRNLFA